MQKVMSFLIYLMLICLIISCVVNNRKNVVLVKSIGWWSKSFFGFLNDDCRNNKNGKSMTTFKI